jgi:hypothetical protein
MSAIEKNTEDYMNNLKLQLKLQQIGLSSWGEEKPREKNKTLQTPYSAKMVDEYKQMLETPYTADDGKTYKYRALPPPDLDEVDNTKLIPLRHSSNDIDQTIRRLKDALEKEEANKQLVFRQIDMYKLYIEANALKTDGHARKRVAKKQAEMENANTKLLEIEDDIKNINEELQILTIERDQTREAEATNKDIINDVSRKNQLKLKTYRDDLNQQTKEP